MRDELIASEGYRGALMRKQPVGAQQRYVQEYSECTVASEYYFQKCQRIRNCHNLDETEQR
jgi:hypothetical protein